MSKQTEILEAVGEQDQPVFGGSSKEFFATSDPQVLRVEFKDLMHGRGRMTEVEGTGRLREEFCFHFYRLLESEGIRTHIATQINGLSLEGTEPLLERGILVRKLDMILLELIARYVMKGNWVDSHKFPVFPSGVVLNEPCVEFCLKWKQNVPNLEYEGLSKFWKMIYEILSHTPLAKILMPKLIERDDPRINEDVSRALHNFAADPRFRGHLIESRDEGEELRRLTLKVNSILAEFMRSQGWFFEDGKFEVGIANGDRSSFLVADEYTQDSCRVSDGTVVNVEGLPILVGGSLTKDLHRQRRPKAEILDAYSRLAEAMKRYSK